MATHALRHRMDDRQTLLRPSDGCKNEMESTVTPDLGSTPAPTGDRRFVLPEDAPYLANLSALWSIDAPLARRIEAIDPLPAYPVQPSKAGPPTLALPTPDGRTLFLHSRYEPLDEASRLLDKSDTDERLAFYIHGFGLGYHVDLLFERASEEALMIVFEPDTRLLKTAFEHRDFSALILSGRVLFFTELEKADLITRLTPHSALLSIGTADIAHAPSEQLHPEFHRQFREWTTEFASFMRTSLNTLLLNGRRTAENIARNLGTYISTPSVARLRNRHQGKPAIIVSAGPSLRKNKHLLAQAAGHAVIVAVQTTLKPLIEMGIEPDYVTSLDYHEICTRFFENLPPSLHTELIAEAKATSGIFSMFPGPVSLVGNSFADQLVREMKLDKATLQSGATVAHLAFYVAEHLGCDPIIFVGQDLGFSDGLCYAPGTSYEDVWRPELSRFCTVEMKQWEQIIRDRYILRRIPDYQGRTMYTEERLFTYLQQFERDFLRSKSRVIDATEGGAAKRGVTYMPLMEALQQFCTDPMPAADDIPTASSPEYRPEQAVECLRKRREEARRIEEISRQTLPLLEEIRDHIEDQTRVNRAIARLDALRAQVNELGHCYDLITQLTQKTELQRFEADRKLTANRKLSEADRQRRQVDRDIDNVRGVMEAAGAFQELMDEVANRLGQREAE